MPMIQEEGTAARQGARVPERIPGKHPHPTEVALAAACPGPRGSCPSRNNSRLIALLILNGEVYLYAVVLSGKHGVSPARSTLCF